MSPQAFAMLGLELLTLPQPAIATESANHEPPIAIRANPIFMSEMIPWPVAASTIEITERENLRTDGAPVVRREIRSDQRRQGRIVALELRPGVDGILDTVRRGGLSVGVEPVLNPLGKVRAGVQVGIGVGPQAGRHRAMVVVAEGALEIRVDGAGAEMDGAGEDLHQDVFAAVRIAVAAEEVLFAGGADGSCQGRPDAAEGVPVGP